MPFECITIPSINSSQDSEFAKMNIVNIINYGAVGDGISDDTSAIVNAITASANKLLYFPSGTYLITNNVAVGSNVAISFANGAKIKCAYGKTFTVNGKMTAGLHQVFENVNGCPNGTFDSSEGWTVGSGWSISGGVATHTIGNTGSLSYNACAGVSGKTFIVKYTVGGTPNGGVIPSIGGVSGYRRSTAGTYVDLITATGSGALTFTPETNFGGTLDNVEVYMLGGYILSTGAVEQVLPQWWGAVGDDSTDCSIAFNMALLETNTIGNMYIPSGTYRISFPIKAFQLAYNSTLSAAIKISGASRKSSIIKYTGTLGYAFEMTSDRPAVFGGSSPYNAMTVCYATISDLQFNASSTSGGAILVGGAYSSRLNNIGITKVQNGNGVFIRSGEATLRSTGRVNDTDRDFTTTGKFAIRFQLLSNSTGYMKSATVRLKRTGTPSGTISASFYSDSSGVPGTKIGKSSNAIECSTLSTNTDGAETTFVFEITDGLNMLPNLSSSSSYYWLVLETNGYTYSDGVTEVILRTKSNDTTGGFAVFDGSSWSSANDGADIVLVSRYGAAQTCLQYITNSYIGPNTDSNYLVNTGIRIEDISQCVLQNSRLRCISCITARGYNLLWLSGTELSVNTDQKCLDLVTATNGTTRYHHCFIENGSVEFKGGRHYFVNTHNSFYPKWSDGAYVYVDRSCNAWIPRDVDDPFHIINFDWIVSGDNSDLELYTSASVDTDTNALTGKCVKLPVQNSMVRCNFTSSKFRWLPPRGVYLCTVYIKDTNNVADDIKLYAGYQDSGGAPHYDYTNYCTATSSYRPYKILMYVTSSIVTIGRGVFFAVSKATSTSNTIYVSHFMVERLGDIGLDKLYTHDLLAHNTENSDADGARDSSVMFIGKKSTGAQSMLAQIKASHDGSSSDEKGKIEFLINDGDDKFAPTKMMTLSSNGLAIGTSGSNIKQITSGTTNIDPPSILATSTGSTSFTLTGASIGDRIIMEPPTDLHDDLIFKGARVTSANTVTVYLYNPTGSAIDDTSKSWNYTWIDLT